MSLFPHWPSGPWGQKWFSVLFSSISWATVTVPGTCSVNIFGWHWIVNCKGVRKRKGWWCETRSSPYRVNRLSFAIFGGICHSKISSRITWEVSKVILSLIPILLSFYQKLLDDHFYAYKNCLTKLDYYTQKIVVVWLKWHFGIILRIITDVSSDTSRFRHFLDSSSSTPEHLTDTPLSKVPVNIFSIIRT